MPHTINSIREAFLSYFEGKGHARIVSAPLVPHNDPTLMFTNAGMVPFKNVFSGAETLTDKGGKKIIRATSSQKCVRAGGKHNDLDNVGYTARHHTFFEMLGNFSFADYFKEGAIPFAWEFLTKVLGIPAEKLSVTVYHTDDEAFNLWKKLTGFPDSKILRIPTSDNFWAMGDTGPCGPCSEIFYDHGVGEGQWALNPDGSDRFGERFVEIWNLVFMQFEAMPDGSRVNLPRPCIDTGMGLERIAAVLQGVHDNYDTDLFRNLISNIKEISSTDNVEHKASYRVIADHLRSCSFLLADGVTPSNEGRGYVLRRIMRRGMRHAHILGCREPLMYRLLPALIAEMGAAYPELIRAQALITETLKIEEERFKETLERGLKLLDEEVGKIKNNSSLPGEVAFKLYDTYGFPLDLTQDILRGQNREVDLAGFDKAMEAQRTRARAAWAGSGEAATSTLWLSLREKHGATEFLGYDTTKASGKVISLIKDGGEITASGAGETVMLLTNQTPFYAESGGQAGDRGIIHTGTFEMQVEDVKKQAGGLHVHIGKVTQGSLKTGDVVEMQVDEARRNGLRAHHSATHLLHAALHHVLGKQVTQKGSLVEADYFRFDFNHPKGLTPEEKLEIEQQVNAVIAQKQDITTRIMTPDEAIAAGAMALFGEKYGDEVRVLSMGKGDNQGFFSIELCGGTHARNTGDIARFVITSESSAAAGIRRIEAATGKAADAWLAGQTQKQAEEETRRMAAEEAKAAQAGSFGQVREAFRKVIGEAQTVGNVTFLGRAIEGVQGKDLRILVDDFKAAAGSGVVAIVTSADGKASIVVGVTDDLHSRLNAVELVKKGVEVLGGKGGGGRPDFAQGGGPNAAKAEDALEVIRGMIG